MVYFAPLVGNDYGFQFAPVFCLIFDNLGSMIIEKSRLYLSSYIGELKPQKAGPIGLKSKITKIFSERRLPNKMFAKKLSLHIVSCLGI